VAFDKFRAQVEVTEDAAVKQVGLSEATGTLSADGMSYAAGFVDSGQGERKVDGGFSRSSKGRF
jgi:hypothetical protein